MAFTKPATPNCHPLSRGEGEPVMNTSPVASLFDAKQLLRGLPVMVKPMIEEFLRDNCVVIGHDFEKRDILTPTCNAKWIGRFIILGTQPVLLIGIFSWIEGGLPESLDTTISLVSVLSGAADQQVARMVLTFHRKVEAAT
jgi:hypothetical protein